MRGGGAESARGAGAWVPTPIQHRPLFTPVQPGSGGRNRTSPVDFALVGGPWAGTRWCEQAPAPSLLGPQVTAPPRPKSGRARTRPHPVGTGPASVRVRGPGLPPVGPERPSEWAADRGGGGPGRSRFMPQNHPISAHIHFFLGSRACAGACEGGGRRALAALVLGCRPPPGTDHALPRFRGTPALYLGLARGPGAGTSWRE
jgi:hypothetical protein